jgi:hypothetical protein
MMYARSVMPRVSRTLWSVMKIPILCSLNFRVIRGSTFLGLAFFALSGGEAFGDVAGEIFGERSPRGCFARGYDGSAAAVVNAEDVAMSEHRTVDESDLDVDVGRIPVACESQI